MRPINQTPQSADGAYERETIINFCDAEKTCSYYTRNYSRMNELRKLATEHPDELTHSHPLRSGILALCNKRWLEVFLRNRVEFTAVFELTLDLLNYGLSPFVQQFQ